MNFSIAVDAEGRADLREYTDHAEANARDGHLAAEGVDVREEIS